MGNDDFADAATIEAQLDHIRAAPRDHGRLELIVARPAVDERAILDEAELDPKTGLVGDTWSSRPSRRTEDGGAHPDMQLNIMNARFARVIAGERERWAAAGDQLYVDLDLSTEVLAPWTKLAIGGAIVEITDQPHTGCAKFRRRFGADALRIANSDAGTVLRLRGANARVVSAGVIHQGDSIVRA